MSDMFIDDISPEDEALGNYRVKVKKAWFRGKDVFTERLHYYEVQLLHDPLVFMPLNAGNMIYTMMQRLQVGVEWRKQGALMRAYRNLVYRLSYTTVIWYQEDQGYLEFSGQKSDVLWTLSFISQVFYDAPLVGVTVTDDPKEQVIAFAIQNGEYVGQNAMQSAEAQALPDIWAVDESPLAEEAMTVKYDPTFTPDPDALFAIPDGRVAQYIRMDDRFFRAREKGTKIKTMEKHNITASLIKDFEDMIQLQTDTDYDVYQLRYSAFMNKTHELEKLIGGFEPSAYDILPIAERGIPKASPETIARTNAMDCNSLKYIYDTLTNEDISPSEKKAIGKDIVHSVTLRRVGYETEYQTYLATGTDEALDDDIYKREINQLYEDFAYIDSLKKFKFSPELYRGLCNVPKSGGPVMTDWERTRIQKFGKGYRDYLDMEIKLAFKKKTSHIWNQAKKQLENNYLNVS